MRIHCRSSDTEDGLQRTNLGRTSEHLTSNVGTSCLQGDHRDVVQLRWIALGAGDQFAQFRGSPWSRSVKLGERLEQSLLEFGVIDIYGINAERGFRLDRFPCFR